MTLWRAVAWCLAIVLCAAGPVRAELTPMVAAFHVHTTASTGSLSLEQVASQAERRGLDAVVLSDNFVLRYEYGLWPLPQVLRRTVQFPSVLSSGLDRFLEDIMRVQARHPKLVLVPGVEVAPHYYWTGTLRAGTLTMHDSQRNLLVIGLSTKADYLALPAAGNYASYRYGQEMLVSLMPGLLLISAGWLWSGRTWQWRSTRRATAVCMTAVALLLLINAWPFGRPLFSIYDETLGVRPYQALIDTVRARQGAVIWSMPEARDFHEYPFGRLGVVTIKTEPYPETLLTTDGYTAFGGVYGDTRKIAEPGQVWDQALTRYLTGRRREPAFVTGEIAFHGPDHDARRLDDVLTVFWTHSRSAGGLMEALRAGRMYAVDQPHPEEGLRLDTLTVESDAGSHAMSGDTLTALETTPLTIRAAIRTADGKAHPISLSLVRSGQVIAQISGDTPFNAVFADRVAAEAHAYRVIVRGPGELVSNPIFVRPLPKEGRA